MRRGVLITALVVLVVIDLSLVPFALMLIFLGGVLTSVHGPGLGLIIYGVPIGGIPITLTAVVVKALRNTP